MDRGEPEREPQELVHPNQDEFLVVAFQATLGRNTVRRILRQVGIDEDDFIDEL